MNYQVLRPFSGYVIGERLGPESFMDEHRATQLVEQRYLSVLPEGKEGYQPSSETLWGTSIRGLRDILPDMVDKSVLFVALDGEERQVARQMYEKRLWELTEADAESAGEKEHA
jgi:hypothetical protein